MQHKHFSTTSFDLFSNGKLLASCVKVPLIGTYNISNILATLSLFQYLQLPLPLTSLQNLKIAGQLELVLKTPQHTIFVDYAHNEASLEKVLSTLKQLKSHRLIVIFGCGSNRSKKRR